MDREKVINKLKSWIDDPYARDTAIDPALVHDTISLLKEQQHQIWEYQELTEYLKDKQPQIVRCKDCKHCDSDTLEHCWCMILARSREPDWFCADGERKTSEKKATVKGGKL